LAFVVAHEGVERGEIDCGRDMHGVQRAQGGFRKGAGGHEQASHDTRSASTKKRRKASLSGSSWTSLTSVEEST